MFFIESKLLCMATADADDLAIRGHVQPLLDT